MLSPRAQRVWAKSGRAWSASGLVPDQRRWLPLSLHLLDSAAVAAHLAENWLSPTICDLLEREFSDSTTGLAPAEEFRLLASWVAGVHDIGKCTPAFSTKVSYLHDRMQEAGLTSEPIDPLERRKIPHGLAGHVILSRWLVETCGWNRRFTKALASVVGAITEYRLPTKTLPVLKIRDAVISWETRHGGKLSPNFWNSL
nr:CRISPR-associated endonuclease Cas3'' [Actinobaculum sp. 313]